MSRRYTGRDSRDILHILDMSKGDLNMNSFYVTRCEQSYYDIINILEEEAPTCVKCIVAKAPK